MYPGFIIIIQNIVIDTIFLKPENNCDECEYNFNKLQCFVTWGEKH